MAEVLKINWDDIKDIQIESSDTTPTKSVEKSTMNKEACNFFKDQGVKRIVLARECNKEQVREIINEVPIEIETFIHGAMCAGISGRCVVSNVFTKRDANRGGCAQICRWVFDYYKNDKKIIDTPFSMTPKDLNMVSLIQDMINSHVFSFKIEGRMRSIYYVSTVILVYRRLMDRILDGTLTPEYAKYSLNILNRVANRESTPQFFDKLPGVNEQYYLGRDELSNQDFLGLVLDYEDGVVTLEQRNNFKIGDTVQFFGPNIETTDWVVDNIIDEDGNEIDVARHPQMIIKLKIPFKVNKNDMMRIKMFDFYK